nr:MAG TPA: hypothetical protein [Caudoviricetes sp.]
MMLPQATACGFLFPKIIKAVTEITAYLLIYGRNQSY